MRRLILAALALFAFFALESCGVSRLAAPTSNARTFGAGKFERDGDGGSTDIGGGSSQVLPDMGDSLKVFRKPSPIGGGTGGDGGAGGDTGGNEQPIAK